jgi:hypothetical protein
MTIRKIALFLSLTLLVALSATLLSAQSPASEQDAAQVESFYNGCDWRCQLREKQAQRIEGSWDITATISVPPGAPQPPPVISHATFSRGGAVFGSDRTRPFSKQHGAWVHLGGNKFASTRTEDLFDPMGNFAGTFKVNLSLTVTRRDEFVGVASVEFRDAAGNLTRNACATVRAARIKVEPLAEQCQSITPPR